ncbi:unnamed protein product [Rotaria socialis]|uniref:G-protein coupled receptors family 1 profile domain-containing protein n=1 Tax=Rotaria socialis TaxID=392032 RepID=A0A821UZW6_9BILA|nr:unnamed protein product [Rotaria socialis]CAF3451940.1 unnamed protein product [Rotaria socialis]CAF4519167.1 unnamed protein product [Rotaria socialis]CAF4898373.1 unnamed protein product [Rotaria socialis]
MSDKQSSNNTGNLSFANTEISMSRTARFWILLLFDIPSIICTLFVLCCVLMDRKLRSSVKNHSLVLFLILGLGTQLVDVPFYLNFIVHSSVIPPNPSICILWWFMDIGMYNGGAILLAWTAFERHIIIFHDRWISTRKRRIIVHYLPLLFLILYIFIFYIYAFYGFPCENSYDYTLPYCNQSPCYLQDPVMGIFDLFTNITMPTLLEAFFSFSFIFRVVWQKYRSHLSVQWRKQRKMAIQLMSLTALNLTINVPLSIFNIAHLCGLPSDIGFKALQYFVFLCYFVIFFLPFICLASITSVFRNFRQKILRQRREITRFTATVRPDNFGMSTMVQIK